MSEPSTSDCSSCGEPPAEPSQVSGAVKGGCSKLVFLGGLLYNEILLEASKMVQWGEALAIQHVDLSLIPSTDFQKLPSDLPHVLWYRPPH